MNQKIICIFLLLFIHFSISCQKKQIDLNQETFDIRVEDEFENEKEEGEIIKKSGIVFTYDSPSFKVGKATQEQFDYLKKQEIRIFKKWEWEEINEVKKTNNFSDLFVEDPYKEKWMDYIPQLLRTYYDLNEDCIPELFLCNDFISSSGGHYDVFQITKKGYQDLKIEIPKRGFQVLKTKHNKFSDIQDYNKWSPEYGCLMFKQYNNFQYQTTKIMTVIYQEAIKEKIYTPDQELPFEQHPVVFKEESKKHYKLLWTPKDDDKYRKMIK